VRVLFRHARGRLPISIPLLCARCSRGDHSRRHSAIGCTEPVMLPPYDLVCRCEEPRKLEVRIHA